MRIRVLGPVAVVDDSGADVTPGSRTQRAILAVLAATPRRVVSSDALIDAVWGTDPPRTAETSLRSHVSRLRSAVGDLVEIVPGGYRLAAVPAMVDGDEFTATVRRVRHEPPHLAVPALESALASWIGPAFGDMADIAAVSPTARALEESRMAATEALAAAQHAAGAHDDAIVTAEGLLSTDALREGAWCVLIGALAAADRGAEALRAAQRARSALADVGLEASERLVAAERAVTAAGTPTRQPMAPSDPRTPPAPTAPLTGRDGDVATIAALLETHRAVSLVGPGGVGKTALARVVAAGIASRHRDGCEFVELADVTTDDAVAPAVAASIGVVTADAAADRVLGRPADRDLLVVLDNCEHVADGSAAVAEALLASGPRTRVLTTSRSAVGISDEWIHPVRPLPVDGDDAVAADLFLRRARALTPDLELDDADRAAIARIVTRLDGLPLALEMAAARVPTMGLVDLADEIDRDQDVLRGVRRTADARHRSLASLIEWSEALLDVAEREALAAMSVFAGRVGLDAVAAVAGHDAAGAVPRLADLSLVEVERVDRQVRFGLANTVRAHVTKRRAVSVPVDAVSRRHLRWIVELADDADAALRGTAEADGHRAVTASLAEARAAHAYARSCDPAAATSLAVSLLLYAQTRLHGEILDWTLDLEREQGGTDGAGGIVAVARALRAVHREGVEVARDAAERAAADRTDHRIAGVGLETLSDLALFSGDLTGCVEAADLLDELGREAGDVHLRVMAAVNRSLAATFDGSTDEATACLDVVGSESIAPSDEGWLAYCRGEIASAGDPAGALDLFERAEGLADSVGNRYLGGIARVSATAQRARVEGSHGSLPAFAEVIRRWRQEGSYTHLATTLRNLVPVLVDVGETGAAARTLGAVGPDTAYPTWGAEELMLATAADRLAGTVPDDLLRQELATGRSLGVDGAAAHALAVITGRLRTGTDDP